MILAQTRNINSANDESHSVDRFCVCVDGFALCETQNCPERYDLLPKCPQLWPPKFGPSNQKMWDPPNLGPPIRSENLSWKINPCEKLARELGPNHPYEPDAEPN